MDKDATTTVVPLMGSDPRHKYANFLIDGRAAMRFLESMSVGVDWFVEHDAPDYYPEYDIPTNNIHGRRRQEYLKNNNN